MFGIFFSFLLVIESQREVHIYNDLVFYFLHRGCVLTPRLRHVGVVARRGKVNIT